MGELFRIGKTVFSFPEGDPHRRPHVHVFHAGRKAKVALDNFEVLEHHGFSDIEVRQIVRDVMKHIDFIREAWDGR